MMRLNRGSGVAGLAGVRERGQVPAADLPLIRPLLAVRREELEQVIRTAGLAAMNDPSNADERFERVRMRQGLANAQFLDAAAIAAAAVHLSEADEALDWAARLEWERQVSVGGEEIRYLRRAPRAVALRVIERAVSSIGSAARGQDLARLLDRMEAGQGGNVAGVLAKVEGEEWLFRPEPARRST
jgi:tRNA(Ile)-lysidine synthase